VEVNFFCLTSVWNRRAGTPRKINSSRTATLSIVCRFAVRFKKRLNASTSGSSGMQVRVQYIRFHSLHAIQAGTARASVSRYLSPPVSYFSLDVSENRGGKIFLPAG